MASHFLVKKKDVLETHIIESTCRIQYLQFKYVPGFLYKIDSTYHAVLKWKQMEKTKQILIPLIKATEFLKPYLITLAF